MNADGLSVFWLQLIGLIALEAGLVAGVLWLVLRRSLLGRWRRTFCQAALIAVLVIGLGEISGASRRLAGLLTGAGRRPDARALVPRVQPAARPVAVNFPVVSEPRDPHTTAASLPPTLAARQRQVDPPTGSIVVRASGPSRREDAGGNRRFGLWVLVAWMAGVMIFGGRVCLARFLFMLFRSRRRVLSDSALLAQVQELSRAVGLKRRVRVIQSQRLATPIAFGVLRPTIGLPPNFEAVFDARKQRVILVHELAHLAAHDPIWYLLADLATTVFWWHPGVWWMRRQLQLASEWAADEASLLVEQGPGALAECLVQLGAVLSRRPALDQLGIEGFRSNLGCRVQRLIRLESRPPAPPWPFLTLAVQSVAPIVLSAGLVAGTAWTLPKTLTAGETMKNIPLNWKRSLAVIGLIIGVTADDAPGAETSAPAIPAGGRPIAGQPAPVGTPANAPRQPYGIGSGGAGEGAPPTGFGLAGFGSESARHGTQLEAKLKQIVLEEVRFDGLPLGEVLHFLSDEARKRDPAKKGVNFLINPNLPAGVAPGAPVIDPASGLPVATPVEPIDLRAVAVNFTLPLRNVTMKDVLDAIVKVADKPIEYSLEDYAVVFSPRPEAAGGLPMLGRTGQAFQEPIEVRTFRVDTNTFLAGLESAFGIKIEESINGKTGARAGRVQPALRELLAQLGITLEGTRSVFYNELTGIMMVRATVRELDVVRAAIETLGGQTYAEASNRSP